MTTYDNYTPSYQCTTVGNSTDGYYGKLNIPIGLMTYDEAIMAGGFYSGTSNYYLTGKLFWTMSPAGSYGDNPYIWNCNYDGHISTTWSVGSNPVRPVINLDKNITVKGLGTSTDPFVVVYTS